MFYILYVLQIVLWIIPFVTLYFVYKIYKMVKEMYDMKKAEMHCMAPVDLEEAEAAPEAYVVEMEAEEDTED